MHKLQVPLFYRPDQQFAINAAVANNISYARPIFDSLDWTEENSREFERIGQTGQQRHICPSSTEVSIKIANIQAYTLYIATHYTYVSIHACSYQAS